MLTDILERINALDGMRTSTQQEGENDNARVGGKNFLATQVTGYSYSDNGTQFKNETIGKFLSNRIVVHTTMPLYNAQVTLVERVNFSVEIMFITHLEGEHTNGDAHITKLIFAYNTAVHDSTGVSHVPCGICDEIPLPLRCFGNEISLSPRMMRSEQYYEALRSVGNC